MIKSEIIRKASARMGMKLGGDLVHGAVFGIESEGTQANDQFLFVNFSRRCRIEQIEGFFYFFDLFNMMKRYKMNAFIDLEQDFRTIIFMLKVKQSGSIILINI